jgi:hypothetical protein
LKSITRTPRRETTARCKDARHLAKASGARTGRSKTWLSSRALPPCELLLCIIYLYLQVGASLNWALPSAYIQRKSSAMRLFFPVAIIPSQSPGTRRCPRHRPVEPDKRGATLFTGVTGNIFLFLFQSTQHQLPRYRTANGKSQLAVAIWRAPLHVILVCI